LGGAAESTLSWASIGVPGEHCVLTMAPGSVGPEALCVHPSDGAAELSGLTHDTCIQVPACAAWAPTAIVISVASANPVMPRNPFAFLVKRAEF
jgi:hypothetical protein